MNPRIPAGYDELGRWLRNFAISHGKREDPRLEAVVEMDETREGRSYGLRLVLGPLVDPPAGSPPVVLGYHEVADGRPRFAWCETLARRIRGDVRRLMSQAHRGGSRSA